MRIGWIYLLLCGAFAVAQGPKGPQGSSNIRISDNAVTRNGTFLSVSDDGSKVDLWPTDDGSGRQKWLFVPGATGQWYNILIGGGVKNGLKYLSVTSDGSKVDLSNEDDGSGRQRWVIEGVPRGFVRIHMLGGVQTEWRFLTYDFIRNQVNLSRADNSAGQRWGIVPAAATPPSSGSPSAPVAANPSDEPTLSPKPIPVSPADAQKLIINQPMHSGIGQMLRANGTVEVEFTVNADGKVQDMVSSPVGSADGNTQGTARNLVAFWQYHPYLVDGKPTPMRTSATLEIHGGTCTLK